MSEADPLIGQVIGGRYRVIKPLGEGGMGQVYLAEHEAIEKMIALKVLRPEYTRKEDIVSRFHQEAISASRIKHPNVLDVFDFGKLDSGAAFLAMEFLEGNDVADELAKHGALDARRGILIALQVCRALAAAHEAGVVHRDMKPDNVFLQRTRDGEEIVKIVDFGIAQLRATNEEEAQKPQPQRRRLTKTGMIFGTPEYMAPEQAAGKQSDRRVDIYAVGVIMYEMFTGAVPFTGETFMAVLAAHLNDPPPPMTQVRPDLALSAELQAVIMKALVKNPAERYQSMTEFAQAIVGTPEGAQFSRGSIAEGRLSSLPSIRPPGMVEATTTAPQTSAGGTQAIAGGTVQVQGTRSDTQLESSTTTTLHTPKRQTGVIVATLAALATAGSIGVYVVYSRFAAPTPPPASGAITPVAEPAPVLATPPNVAPVPTAPPVVEPAPVKTGVTLSVETEPAGAVLFKNGFQVCDSTPCAVEADPNEQLQLEAKKDALKGSTKVLAQKNQTVTIKLGVAPVYRKPVEKPPAGPKMCEVDVGGLKILRPCN